MVNFLKNAKDKPFLGLKSLSKLAWYNLRRWPPNNPTVKFLYKENAAQKKYLNYNLWVKDKIMYLDLQQMSGSHNAKACLNLLKSGNWRDKREGISREKNFPHPVSRIFDFPGKR